MKQIYEMLLRLFGIQPSIESIVKPITTIVSKLDAHAAAEEEKRLKALIRAEREAANASASELEVQRAKELSSKYGALVGQ